LRTPFLAAGFQAHSTPLEEYRANPAQFIANTLIDPETGKPFQLLPAEVASLFQSVTTKEATVFWRNVNWRAISAP
jgi:hypothetical protein